MDPVPAVTSVRLVKPGTGLPPLEEFLTAESWLQALPTSTVLRIGVESGPSFLATAGQLVDGRWLVPVSERLRIQQRLAELGR